jgi:2-C-methyl-D-erythritol 2,4-cyclodiphosphate synthase
MVQGLAPARKPVTGQVEPASTQRVVAPFRVGHGYDIHRLQPGAGGKLVLGGVVVSDELTPIAHSDGDVVIHALVDALLGAMGWGDIGEHFPADDLQWKGAASSVFLNAVLDRVRNAGYRVLNADVTIQAERPTLATYKREMVRALQQMLGPASAVNIKSGTNEGCDAIGRGEAVAAHAVVLLAAEA